MNIEVGYIIRRTIYHFRKLFRRDAKSLKYDTLFDFGGEIKKTFYHGIKQWKVNQLVFHCDETMLCKKYRPANCVFSLWFVFICVNSMVVSFSQIKSTRRAREYRHSEHRHECIRCHWCTLA